MTESVGTNWEEYVTDGQSFKTQNKSPNDILCLIPSNTLPDPKETGIEVPPYGGASRETLGLETGKLWRKALNNAIRVYSVIE